MCGTGHFASSQVTMRGNPSLAPFRVIDGQDMTFRRSLQAINTSLQTWLNTLIPARTIHSVLFPATSQKRPRPHQYISPNLVQRMSTFAETEIFPL